MSIIKKDLVLENMRADLIGRMLGWTKLRPMINVGAIDFDVRLEDSPKELNTALLGVEDTVLSVTLFLNHHEEDGYKARLFGEDLVKDTLGATLVCDEFMIESAEWLLVYEIELKGKTAEDVFNKIQAFEEKINFDFMKTLLRI